MTSKLKCPFCQKGLSQGYNHDRDTVIYHCNNCYFQGDGIIWQALIQAKQDLAKAIDVIDTVRQYKRGTAVICPNDIAAYCDKALEQIEHKEDK